MTQSFHTYGEVRWVPTRRAPRGMPGRSGQRDQGSEWVHTIGNHFQAEIQNKPQAWVCALRSALSPQEHWLGKLRTSTPAALIPTKSLPREARALTFLKAPRCFWTCNVQEWPRAMRHCQALHRWESGLARAASVKYTPDLKDLVGEAKCQALLTVTMTPRSHPAHTGLNHPHLSPFTCPRGHQTLYTHPRGFSAASTGMQ